MMLDDRSCSRPVDDKAGREGRQLKVKINGIQAKYASDRTAARVIFIAAKSCAQTIGTADHESGPIRGTAADIGRRPKD